MAVQVQTMPGLNVNGPTNGDITMADTPVDSVNRFATGLILPPPEIKSVIDRTSSFVARSANPPQFEEKIRENQRNDPKFSFLNSADPYHAYYRHRMQRVLAGEVDDEATTDDTAKAEEKPAEERKPVDMGKEPPAPEFTLELPNMSAVDLDIMKLTALFTAQRGRSFLAALSVKEGRNYQFDFLRPTHSLFGYFNRLVEQYAKVLSPSFAQRQLVKSRAQPAARWVVLEEARQHAKWEQNKRDRDRQREDQREAERIAFAEIDWHDYAIVQTIEFTAADAGSALPAPMSLQQVENMTLAQKRMAAMIHESTVDDVEALRAQQAAEEAAANDLQPIDVGMDQSDDEGEAQRKQREEEEHEAERARAIQANSLGVTGSMKIRTDYVPKLGAKAKSQTTKCSICGQQIPVDELQEHMRIELLDPKWKSQRDALEARKAQASELQRGANVVDSLKSLARARVDLFGAEVDEERRRREEEEERERRKEREKVVWDGHTNSKVSTQDRFSTTVNFDEQIAAIMRSKGLGPQEANAMGPGIGPAAAPPPLTGLPPAPASLPPPPHVAIGAGSGGVGASTYAAATVASGPQPASAYPPPVMLPPLHYQGLGASQPFGYQPPPSGVMGTPPVPGILPGGPLGGLPQVGAVRSADQMDDSPDGAPPAKRQKVAKLPGGQYYPEQDWINMHPHPISLQVQMPNDPSKPEWKLDGSVVTLPELPLGTFVSTLRDRILQITGSTVGASRMLLSHGTVLLANKNTIASYNLEEDDVLTLSLRDPKKK